MRHDISKRSEAAEEELASSSRSDDSPDVDGEDDSEDSDGEPMSSSCSSHASGLALRNK
jgi:hypothetical protein